jgi:hypothetical protein
MIVSSSLHCQHTIPLELSRLSLTFRCVESMHLPRWKGALLRGGLGWALYELFCKQSCARDCHGQHIGYCPFTLLFAPLPNLRTSQSRRKKDIPRPYIIHPPLDAKTFFAPSDELHFGISLIGAAIEIIPEVVAAFQFFGTLGLGLDRGKAELVNVTSVNRFINDSRTIWSPAKAHGELLLINGEQINDVARTLPPTLRLHLYTPMRLKFDQRYIRTPECHHLIRRALDRISELCEAYGDYEWEVDRGALIQMAEQVPARTRETHWVDWGRTSGATGQHMQLGGCIGTITLENTPEPLRHILLAGSIFHIGKATVFGHGGFHLDRPPEQAQDTV